VPGRRLLLLPHLATFASAIVSRVMLICSSSSSSSSGSITVASCSSGSIVFHFCSAVGHSAFTLSSTSQL
ncbi:hypothetical protein PIB30_107592, partial [Stylosanthes scabra]|nr:hypothetical protein [Stylosanthes scabra]